MGWEKGGRYVRCRGPRPGRPGAEPAEAAETEIAARRQKIEDDRRQAEQNRLLFQSLYPKVRKVQKTN